MKNPASPFPVRIAEIVEVLRTESIWGEGVEGNPMRLIIQYWTMDGRELVNIDTWKDIKERT